MAVERSRYQFAAMCYDAAAMMVWGAVAIWAMTSATNQFGGSATFSAAVWGDSAATVALGLVMIVAAFFAASSRATTNNIGGVFGVICSVLGALATIGWISSVNSSNFYNPSFINIYAALGPAAVLFAGLPLGLIGSLMAFRSTEAKSESLQAAHQVEVQPAG